MGKLYSVAEAAHIAGISRDVLPKWEERYGWPKPARVPDGSRPDGRRVYTELQVEELAAVAVHLSKGTPIGRLIVDGELRLPAPPCPTPDATISELQEQVAILVECVGMPPAEYLSDRGRVRREMAMMRVKAYRQRQAQGAR